jgi:hypothetical protein
MVLSSLSLQSPGLLGIQTPLQWLQRIQYPCDHYNFEIGLNYNSGDVKRTIESEILCYSLGLEDIHGSFIFLC